MTLKSSKQIINKLFVIVFLAVFSLSSYASPKASQEPGLPVLSQGTDDSQISDDQLLEKNNDLNISSLPDKLTGYSITRSATNAYSRRSYDEEDIDPKTWRFVQLEKSEPDGSLSKVDLLRPTWWLNEYMADDGKTLHLDLSEIGMSGTYNVKAIKPCPPIKTTQAGTQPVIGKFTHQNAAVLDMVFEGESKPLGVTPNHPIWSETHQAYLPADQFKVGEEVQTVNGIAKLQKVSQRPGRHTVYNLEVHKDHVYRVGESGILVHNKALRNSDYLPELDDVIDNPRMLNNQNLDYAKQMFNRSKNWNETVMKRSRHGGGWVAEQVKGNGSLTGRRIQWHPGTPRHFNGEPYWKISAGELTNGPIRLPAGKY